MATRSFQRLSTLLALMVALASLAYAQDNGGTPSNKQRFEVSRGFAVVNNLKYPVFQGIREVDSTPFGGISFTLEQKNRKTALLMAEKIKRFYTGKKIGGTALPVFRKISKPETTAWNSVKCLREKEGAQAVVKVENRTVTVYLFPSCDQDVLAHIL
jgi:hypothetical protein